MRFIYIGIKFFSVLFLLYWPVVLFTSVMMFPNSEAANHRGHVFSTMAIVIYPIYICALYWIFDASLFTIKGRTLFIASVVIVLTGMSMLGYTNLLTNIAKNVNSRGYTIKENTVYFDGKVIENADPVSFRSFTANLKEDLSSFNSPYTADKNQVYYQGKAVEGADPATAKVLDPEFKWWLTDKSSVYFKGNKLRGVSSQNYELRNHLFVLTPTEVFFEDKPIASVDRDTFEIVRNRITKDINHIFYEHEIILRKADPKSFQMFPEDSELSGFGYDNKYLHDPYKDKTYPEIDIESFKGFERGYYTDKNAVYTSTVSREGLTKLEGADPSKFQVTGWDEKTGSDANDGTLFFVNGERVK